MFVDDVHSIVHGDCFFVRGTQAWPRHPSSVPAMVNALSPAFDRIGTSLNG
jgi:hypothetical protein